MWLKTDTISIVSNCLAWDQKCGMKPITDISTPFAAPRTVVNVAGSRYVILATAPETNSAYSAFEIFVPPSAGSPLDASRPLVIIPMVRPQERKRTLQL